MVALSWDGTGERKFETGVDHGVLYPLNTGTGTYDTGVAWNGLTAVTETPGGAEPNPQYADNIKYLNLLSAETFGGTVEAYTYPDEFAACDGSIEHSPGVMIGQQDRAAFGLSYRTKIGNDVSSELGYKLHLIYGLLASPSEKAFTTVNDSPEPVALSWDVTSSPVPVTGHKPLSQITIDSTQVSSADMAELEAFLYGTAGTNPSLPLPDDVLAIFSASLTEAVPVEPTFTAATHTITIPAVTGLQYLINNAVVSGDVVIAVDTVVTCRVTTGYKFPAVCVDEWLVVYS